MSARAFVRRERSGGFLAYHDATCRHARGRPDAVPVPAAEVEAALRTFANHSTRVEFHGHVRYVWPCGVCLRVPLARPWP